MRSLGGAIALVSALASVGSAAQVPITIFNNDAGANPAGLSIYFDVTDNLDGTASVVLKNESTGINSGATVKEIYFELSAASSGFQVFGIDDDNPEKNGPLEFVDFAETKSYGKPDGGMPGWTSKDDTLYQIGIPDTAWGVQAGETLDLTVDYTGTFADLLDLLHGVDGFRIAMHIGSLEQGKSVWGVTDEPATVIPLPSATGMALAGIAGVSLRRRR